MPAYPATPALELLLPPAELGQAGTGILAAPGRIAQLLQQGRPGQRPAPLGGGHEDLRDRPLGPARTPLVQERLQGGCVRLACVRRRRRAGHVRIGHASPSHSCRGSSTSTSPRQANGSSLLSRYPHKATTDGIPAARAATMSRSSSPT